MELEANPLESRAWWRPLPSLTESELFEQHPVTHPTQLWSEIGVRESNNEAPPAQSSPQKPNSPPRITVNRTHVFGARGGPRQQHRDRKRKGGRKSTPTNSKRFVSNQLAKSISKKETNKTIKQPANM